jgi:2-oxoglutarate ferredoxin oxidoreductase subunit beta
VLRAAHAHQGAAFVEIFQNCIVYNKDRFDDFTARPVADANQLWTRHGEPLLFGKGIKGIAFDAQALRLAVVDVTDGDWQAAGVLVHDQTNRSLAHLLVEMPFGAFPMALGVIYDDPRATYESALLDQDVSARAGKSTDLGKLLAKGQTWTVAG